MAPVSWRTGLKPRARVDRPEPRPRLTLGILRCVPRGSRAPREQVRMGYATAPISVSKRALGGN